MARRQAPTFDIALLYIDTVPIEYFQDFRDLAAVDGFVLIDEPRENVPYAALEWVVPTAIAVYVGMKFIESFVKRAADDLSDSLYPKIRAAIVGLVDRLLIRERARFSVVTSGGPKKVTSPHSLIFCVYADTRLQKRAKFIFEMEMSAAQYAACVEHLFELLSEHHRAEGNSDRMSREIVNMSDIRSSEVYLVYNIHALRWEVVDPIQEVLKRQATDNK
jgi:hypothetical protein